jgi:hypothetical protein
MGEEGKVGVPTLDANERVVRFWVGMELGQVRLGKFAGSRYRERNERCVIESFCDAVTLPCISYINAGAYGDAFQAIVRHEF